MPCYDTTYCVHFHLELHVIRLIPLRFRNEDAIGVYRAVKLRFAGFAQLSVVAGGLKLGRSAAVASVTANLF